MTVYTNPLHLNPLDYLRMQFLLVDKDLYAFHSPATRSPIITVEGIMLLILAATPLIIPRIGKWSSR